MIYLPLRDDTHDVGLLHDDEILAVDLDFGARPFSKEHSVADLDVERIELAVIPSGAGPGGDDFALHRLFLCGIGDDDAALRLFLLLDSTDQDAILQWSKIHGISSVRAKISIRD